ncbi:MAG: hypothetical protein KZY55_13625 [Paeniclostridium sp.]|nr:hypothetical protein [Paeniclostridium sp.]MBW4863699.1 hypothetical protein [Paeniclostridium sp.]MBW4875095.1 hypothetical protein [Paeniclostridium sp.]
MESTKQPNKNNILDSIYKIIMQICSISILITILLNLVLSLELPKGIRIADNSWVGFWGSIVGSIIGATITLMGIRITINESNRSQKEYNKLQISPYIVFYTEEIEDINTILDNNEDILTLVNVIDDKSREIYNQINKISSFSRSEYKKYMYNIHNSSRTLNFSINLENVGMNCATYMYIDEIAFWDVNNNYDGTYEETNRSEYKFSRNTKVTQGMKVGKKINLVFSINFSCIKEKSMYITLRYKDLLGYEYKVILRIASSIHGDENEQRLNAYLHSVNYGDYDKILV